MLIAILAFLLILATLALVAEQEHTLNQTDNNQPQETNHNENA